MGYDAFMSYSHAADSQLAPKLQDGLQRMAKPWWRRRSLHVFRDTTGLTANPGLWSSIETAMEDSEWFVFLASPEAAASPWVAREVAHWLEVRGPDRLLPVVTDGTWTWDPERNDFDWAACTAVPAALAGVFAEEPRHVDMSWARSEEQLDLRNGRFRDQVAEIAAPIHGMAKDDLEGVDIREHRRTLRWAWGAAAALLLLALASTFAGVTAVRNADEAALQRIAAQRNASEAQDQKQVANENAADADAQKRAAEKSAAEAQSQKQAADTNAAEAQTQQQAAQASATEAETQKSAADANAADAQTQKTAAQASAVEARKQQGAAQSSATEAQRQRSAAQASERTAQKNAAEAIQQRAVAQDNATRADTEAGNARQSADNALASQRLTEQALQNETQARAAETAARQQAEQSAAEALRAQVAAENATAAESAARSAESAAKTSAQTEALASASKAQASQDGSLSLLLAVEAYRRGRPAPAAAAVVGDAGLEVASDTAADSATGRRALFEAVTASQGGAVAYRVDRYLAFPPQLQDPPSYVWKPVLSADGRYLAAAELADPYRGVRGPTPSRVFVWDLRSAKPSVTVLSGHTEQVAELAFAGGGRTLVTQDVPFDLAVPPTTRIWSVPAGRELVARPGTASVSPTGGHVVVQTFPVALAQVEIIDGADGRLLAVQPGFLSRDLLGNIRETQSTPYIEQPFSPDGRYALGESGGRAVLWDLAAGGAPTIPLAGPSALSSYAPRVSPDGSLVAAFEERPGGQTALSLYDPSTGQLLAAAPAIQGILVNSVWSPDGLRLATIDSNGTVIVLDLDGDPDDISWGDGQVPLGETSFTPDGRYFTVTVPNGGGYVTVVHDTETGADLGNFEGELLAASAGDRPNFFLRRIDGTLNVVDPATGRPTLSDDVADSLTAAAVSDSGRWLAASTASGIRIWDLRGSGRPVSAAGVAGQAFGLAFLPGDDRLVGVGIGGVPTMWDLSRVGAGDRIGTVAPDSSVLQDGVTALEPGRRSPFAPVPQPPHRGHPARPGARGRRAGRLRARRERGDAVGGQPHQRDGRGREGGRLRGGTHHRAGRDGQS